MKTNKMQQPTSALIGLTMIALATQNLSAGAFRLPDQDAFATARGEAFAATADNASAIYYNPAGIGQLRGHNLRGGLYNIWLQTSYDSPAGQSVDSRGKIHPVPSLFYAYGCEKLPLSFGLGVYSPYGLSMEWPDSAPFRTIAVEGSLEYTTVNPVAAWRVTPTLSIAAGLTLNQGKTDLKQGVFAPGDYFKFKGDDTDVGYNLGLLWQVSSNVSFGMAYRSATTLKLDGNTSSTYPGLNGPAQASLPFPQNVTGGISWRPTPKWNFEFDVEWTDWNRVNSLQIESAVPLPPTVLNWESSFYYKVGGTRYFDNGWTVSAGYIYNQSAMPDQFYNPFVADQDRHFVSVGTGYRGQHWSFDLAYQFGYGPSRDVQGGTAADGTYTFISHAISVTTGYHF